MEIRLTSSTKLAEEEGLLRPSNRKIPEGLRRTYLTPVIKINYKTTRVNNGGGGRIRTLGGLSPTTVFKTAAINRSATPPTNI